MSALSIPCVMAVILAGACVQSAPGFGTIMITMGFLPLVISLVLARSGSFKIRWKFF